jgi:hypothetical protein
MCNYLWPEYVRCALRKAWKAARPMTRVIKQGKNNTKRLAFTSAVGLVVEYGATSWVSTKEGQMSALNRLQSRGEQLDLQIIQMNQSGE